jgi:ABC-type multidrug transport system ATPase subunit
LVPKSNIWFLGKNGAGKTTTMKMIIGSYKSDSG